MRNRASFFVTFGTLLTLSAVAGDVPKAPVPQSPFIRIVYGYADAMLKNGRDNYRPQKTGLFLSALDRSTMAPLTNTPAPPEGIRAEDRVGRSEGALVGANLHHDENLLRLLYTLSELSGKPPYRAAADAELKWFFENAASTNDAFSWSWDVLHDEPIVGNGARQIVRPWILWDRCFDVAPDASKRLANNIRQNQERHPANSLRQIGFDIRTFAVAYARTKDEQFLHATDALLSRCERELEGPTGASHSRNTPLADILSLTIDCDGAAHRVPEPLAARRFYLQMTRSQRDRAYRPIYDDGF